MPVVVGVIVSIMLLISFSGWFFNLASGWNEYILDDVYFNYRVLAATLLSITVITITFFGMAYAFECPNEEKQGLFASLNCADYRNIKTGAESLFLKGVVNTEEISIEIPE